MPLQITPGSRFNRLLVLEETRNPARNGQFWVCQCDCGNKAVVRASYLRSGSTKGCGCVVRENNLKHGHSRSPEYRSWESAKARCYLLTNKRFPLYGGRGISMCDEWKNSFASFYRDMGVRPTSSHSLERKDGNGNYEPSNCEWATATKQNNNRSINRHVMIGGLRFTVAQASRLTGIPHGTILSRLDAGKTDEEAVKNA